MISWHDPLNGGTTSGGPEHLFPAPLHDIEDVLRWVGMRPELFDWSRVAVSGHSWL
ncbi:hypothetical protein F4778DRAFT_784567 [Xylariomycetidae sp. FL2044]|nr:hypothetical protein F4778DRAFT_784567 [Xylariomycetidae sp. FL2044]